MGSRRAQKTDKSMIQNLYWKQDIPVTKNKNRINRSNDFCSGSYFCTCTGAA